MKDGDDEQKWAKERLLLTAPSVPSIQQFNIVRRVYQQDKLNKDADYQKPKPGLRRRVNQWRQTLGFDRSFFTSSIPILQWLPRYKIKEYLAGDIVAGLTVAIMHIPQGMGYALLAEVPPVVGLYMAFFPVLIYVLLGTSPHVSMGTFAVACLMTGQIIVAHSSNYVQRDMATGYNSTDPDNLISPKYETMEILSLITFVVGGFQLLMWLCRLGAVATLLSDPLVSGFTTAAALHVLTSQLKEIFGLRLPPAPRNFGVVFTVIAVIKQIQMANLCAVALSFTTMIIIAFNNEVIKGWAAKKCSFPVPIELLAIVIGTVVSKFCGLYELYNIKLVGHIPTGLPMPSGLPPFALFPAVALPCFTITMVTFTISMSMALIFASKAKYEVQGNQELLAMGASNIFGAFFSCAPMCASLSRSYIQFQTGAKTTLTAFISCASLLLILLWVGPLFERLPRAVLAGIIAVSLKGMFWQVKDLVRFKKLSSLDAAVWIITFLATLLINIDIGLFVGLITSLATIFIRTQNAHNCLLGRIQDTDIYLDTKRYRAAGEIPGVKIFRYCGGLNFATKNHFRGKLLVKVGVLRGAGAAVGAGADQAEGAGENDHAVQWDQHFYETVQCLIIDATALCYVDAPGVKMLYDIKDEFTKNNITVLMAGANGPVLEMIERYNKTVCRTATGEALEVTTFPTVHDAVLFYQMMVRKTYQKTIQNSDQTKSDVEKNGYKETALQINDHTD